MADFTNTAPDGISVHGTTMSNTAPAGITITGSTMVDTAPAAITVPTSIGNVVFGNNGSAFSAIFNYELVGGFAWVLFTTAFPGVLVPSETSHSSMTAKVAGGAEVGKAGWANLGVIAKGVQIEIRVYSIAYQNALVSLSADFMQAPEATAVSGATFSNAAPQGNTV